MLQTSFSRSFWGNIGLKPIRRFPLYEFLDSKHSNSCQLWLASLFMLQRPIIWSRIQFILTYNLLQTAELCSSLWNELLLPPSSFLRTDRFQTTLFQQLPSTPWKIDPCVYQRRLKTCRCIWIVLWFFKYCINLAEDYTARTSLVTSKQQDVQIVRLSLQTSREAIPTGFPTPIAGTTEIRIIRFNSTDVYPHFAMCNQLKSRYSIYWKPVESHIKWQMELQKILRKHPSIRSH